MKKLVVILLVLLLVQGIYAQPILFNETLNLESFRHQATASIEDDLDNGIDGTDIFKVEGTRLFTNLSNLSSGYENLMDDYSDNTLVIGGISPEYKGWKAALIYGDRNLLGRDESTDDSTYTWDSDLDTIFDRTDNFYGVSFGDESALTNCILLNIGKRMGEESQIAFTYRRGEYKEESSYKDSLYYTRTNLSTSALMVLYTTAEKGNSIVSIPSTLYELSYTKPFRNWTLRGDVYLNSSSYKYNSDDTELRFDDYTPADPNTTVTRLDSSLIEVSTEEASAKLAGIALRLSDENEYGLWEISGNFGMIFGSADYQDLEASHLIIHGMSGPNVYTYSARNDDNEATTSASVSGTNMGLGARTEWKISEHVIFGLGAVYSRSSLKMEGDVEAIVDYIEHYDDGDGVAEASDYDITDIEGALLTYIEETSSSNLVIPAGLEIAMGKKKDWFLRLGALAVSAKRKYTETTEVDSVIRGTYTNTPGVGAPIIIYDDAINYVNTEDIISTSTQDVDFVYGVGWKPSPNLSLDLVGIFDAPSSSPIIISAVSDGGSVDLLSTGWLKSLRLSATINIY